MRLRPDNWEVLWGRVALLAAFWVGVLLGFAVEQHRASRQNAMLRDRLAEARASAIAGWAEVATAHASADWGWQAAAEPRRRLAAPSRPASSYVPLGSPQGQEMLERAEADAPPPLWSGQGALTGRVPIGPGPAATRPAIPP